MGISNGIRMHRTQQTPKECRVGPDAAPAYPTQDNFLLMYETFIVYLMKKIRLLNGGKLSE